MHGLQIGRHMPGLQLFPQYDQGAGQAVTATGADFKVIGAQQLDMAARIAAYPQLATGDGFIQQLQVAAFGDITAQIHCRFPHRNAVKPEPDSQGQNDQ